MSRAPTWQRTLNQAYDKMGLGETYADDGAFLTAADRLEAAAKLFRLGYAQRVRAIQKALKA